MLRAARAGGPSRVVAVFQPHRYSRTRDLLDEFGPALGARRRRRADGHLRGRRSADSRRHARRAGGGRRADRSRDLHVVPKLDDVPAAVAALVRPGDLVLTLGAGSIGATGDRILRRLADLPHADAGAPASSSSPTDGATGGARRHEPAGWRHPSRIAAGNGWRACPGRQALPPLGPALGGPAPAGSDRLEARTADRRPRRWPSADSPGSAPPCSAHRCSRCSGSWCKATRASRSATSKRWSPASAANAS